MKYHCSDCNYLYDENFGEKEYEIPAFTLFSKLDDTFICPNCGNPKEFFIELAQEILIPFDKENLTFLEEVHYPKYEINWEKMKISLIHPQKDDHFIYKISLYDEYWEKVDEKEVKKENTLEFDLDYLDNFEIRVYCNLEWTFSTWLIQK